MITTRGDTAIITASVTFSKKDTQKESWEEVKLKLIAGIIPSYLTQFAEVEALAKHEAEVRERLKESIGGQ